MCRTSHSKRFEIILKFNTDIWFDLLIWFNNSTVFIIRNINNLILLVLF